MQLQLFTTKVDSVFHGAELWTWSWQHRKQPALGAPRGGRRSRWTHILYLGQLLGVRQSTPSGAVLVEADEQRYWLRWLRRANSMVEALLDCFVHQALELPASRQLAEAVPSAAAARLGSAVCSSHGSCRPEVVRAARSATWHN